MEYSELAVALHPNYIISDCFLDSGDAQTSLERQSSEAYKIYLCQQVQSRMWAQQIEDHVTQLLFHSYVPTDYG